MSWRARSGVNLHRDETCRSTSDRPRSQRPLSCGSRAGTKKSPGWQFAGASGEGAVLLGVSNGTPLLWRIAQAACPVRFAFGHVGRRLVAFLPPHAVGRNVAGLALHPRKKAPGAANRPGLPPRIRLSGVHAVLSAKTFHQGLGVIICRGAFLFGSLANMPTACGRLKHPDIEIPPPCVRLLQFVCILGNQWGVRAFCPLGTQWGGP